MATAFTIVSGSAEQTAAQWGVQHDSFKRVRQATGHGAITFTTVPEEFSDAPVFVEGAELVVWLRNLDADGAVVPGSGTRWFCGTVQRVRRLRAANGFHFHQFTVPNRMLKLEQANYHQRHYFQDGSVDAQGHRLNNTASFFTRDVLVPFDALLGVLTTEAQVRSCLSYAIADVLPPIDLQIGTISLAPAGYEGGTVPLRQFQGPKVAEVIRAMTDCSPDAITYIDDATVPSTFHVRRWGDLTAVTLGLGAGVNLIESVEIEPLDDLVAEGVLFQFRRIDEMDGVSAQYLVYQSASAAGYFTWEGNQSVPALALTGREINVVCDTFDMAGVKINVLRSDVEVVPAAVSTAAWWQEFNSQLGDEKVSDVTIENVTLWIEGVKLSAAAAAALLAAQPNDLVFGAITDWMLETNFRPTGVNYDTVEVRCEAKFKRWNDAAHTQLDQDYTTRTAGIPFHVSGRIITDAVTQVYRENVVDQYADEIPEGLARWYYEAASVRHWAGSIEIVEQSIADRVTLGNRLNLSGGEAAWLTMNAMITQIEDGPGFGRTIVSFGPPKSRNARDRIDFLKMNRVQGRRTTSAGAVQSGRTDGSRTISQSTVTARWNSTSGFVGGSGGTSGWVV